MRVHLLFQWDQWKHPEWVVLAGAHFTIHHSDSVLAVAKNLLCMYFTCLTMSTGCYLWAQTIVHIGWI